MNIDLNDLVKGFVYRDVKKLYLSFLKKVYTEGELDKITNNKMTIDDKNNHKNVAIIQKNLSTNTFKYDKE